MKFYDTHFDDYIQSNNTISLHPTLTNLYKTFPPTLHELKNLIFYGPKGVGKYTQMLTAIKKYSPTELKYEKKLSITYNKNNYVFKISDIHYEIDLSLLGCHSKLLWNEVYNQIVDIILAKSDNKGIIVCKYFHEIHSELLDSLYSYMQTLTTSTIDLKFIIITEQISFIPDNILNCCKIITVPRPSRLLYNKCLDNKLKKNTTIALNEITNMKNIQASITQLMLPHEVICTKIYDTIINIEDMNYLELRDQLYDIFIYHLDVTECIWYITEKLIRAKKIVDDDINDVLVKTYSFLQYYNNNYRPIYHLEFYIFYLIMKVGGIPP
jgi:hypothetical protein